MLIDFLDCNQFIIINDVIFFHNQLIILIIINFKRCFLQELALKFIIAYLYHSHHYYNFKLLYFLLLIRFLYSNYYNYLFIVNFNSKNSNLKFPTFFLKFIKNYN